MLHRNTKRLLSIMATQMKTPLFFGDCLYRFER